MGTKIKAGELHQYVQTNVVQQSTGSQTPELQGDADRVPGEVPIVCEPMSLRTAGQTNK